MLAICILYAELLKKTLDELDGVVQDRIFVYTGPPHTQGHETPHTQTDAGPPPTQRHTDKYKVS